MDRLDNDKIKFALQRGPENMKDELKKMLIQVNALTSSICVEDLAPYNKITNTRHVDESDDEPLSKRMKKIPASDDEIKKFVKQLLDESNLDQISMKIVAARVNARYNNTVSRDLIEETVDSYLKHRLTVTASVFAKKVEVPSQNSTIPLMQIGNSTKRLVFYDQSGYMYSKKTASNNAKYLRCKNKKHYNCNASVIVRNNNFEEAVVIKMHNHEQEPKHIDRVKFNKKLEEICRKQPFSTGRHCYQEAKIQLKNEIDRKNIPSLKSFESLIYRCQKADIPLLPHTIAQLETLITDSKYGKRYTHDAHGDLFFRGVWRGPTGDNVAFVSNSTLKEVKKLKKIIFLMDGTFKVLPLHLRFRQLYIINVIIGNQCFPLAFILMEKKDAKSYEIIFNKIKEMISSSFTELQCMSDYEAATRKALKKVFPMAKIFGCYFHYVQAITKAFRRFGLKKEEKFKLAMQKISALALLPNDYIVEGFNSIAKDFKKSKRFARFEDYWKRQWAGANISVYGLFHRTNNYAESLNKTINLLIGNKHPHVWRLIHNLKLVEMDKSDELERVLAGETINKRKNKAMKQLNKKIDDATSTFNEDPNVNKFLKNVTFQENLQSYFKERIFLDGIDKEEEEENFIDDDEDEDIIPNDFRETTNFRKIFPRKCINGK